MADYTQSWCAIGPFARIGQRFRSEEHTSELQSQSNLVCRLLLEKKTNHSIALSHFPHLLLEAPVHSHDIHAGSALDARDSLAPPSRITLPRPSPPADTNTSHSLS